MDGEAVPYRLVSSQEVIERGDIVVFELPQAPDGVLTTKRVVGLGGETIEIRGDRIVINGEVVQEDWATHPAERVPSAASQYRTSPPQTVSLDPVEIPSNMVFVLGDNWENSFDSRFYGPIAVERILGVVDLQQLESEQRRRRTE
jgi:signal peptidase I